MVLDTGLPLGLLGPEFLQTRLILFMTEFTLRCSPAFNIFPLGFPALNVPHIPLF